MIVEYTSQALFNATEIVAYLRNKFSQAEIDNFYQSLSDFENITSLYPNLYPESHKVKIRKAVLSKVLSVYYTKKNNKIIVIAILDNRWDDINLIK